MTFKFQYVWESLPALLQGAGITLLVSIPTMALGLMIGLGITALRQIPHPWLQRGINLYISFMRGTPLLVLIFLAYYVIPAIGINLPPVLAGVLALSCNSGGYVSEILRGGLSSLPRGQVEAARAFGMTQAVIWKRILLPQVLVATLPPLTNEFTTLVKVSSLLSVITIVELTRKAQQLVATTFRPTEVYITAAVLYFILCFSLSAVGRKLESLTAVYKA